MRRAKWSIIVVTLLVAVGIGCVLAMRQNSGHARAASGFENIHWAARWLHEYAKEHEGQLPAVSSDPGRLIPDPEQIYPKYFPHPGLLLAEGDERVTIRRDTYFLDEYEELYIPELFDDDSYVYLGYAVTTEGEWSEYVKRYLERAREGAGFDEDMVCESGKGTLGTDRLLRLNTGIDELLRKEEPQEGEETGTVASLIPVLIERPGLYGVKGAWVAYLDGSARWVKQGEFPLTHRVLTGIAALDQMEGRLR